MAAAAQIIEKVRPDTNHHKLNKKRRAEIYGKEPRHAIGGYMDLERTLKFMVVGQEEGIDGVVLDLGRSAAPFESPYLSINHK